MESGKQVTMTGLAKYLNNLYKWKSTREPFNISDAQGYIGRGHLPVEYGGNKLTLNEPLHKATGVKLYIIE
jgi:hypothetical protein